MAHKLTTAKPTGPIVEHVEGDILAPLRRIQAKYQRRAEYLDDLSKQDNGQHNNIGQYHYTEAAQAVSRLITQGRPQPVLERHVSGISATISASGSTIPPGPDCCSPECDVTFALARPGMSVSAAFPKDEPLFAQ